MEGKFIYEVFLGGNTSGYTFIGKEDGRGYLEKFYQEKEKESEFLQIKRDNNYVYYSFVVCGIANKEGRKGDSAHFNLTLRLSNCYFTDICLLYDTMINIYNNQILNHIIRNGKYIIDDFVTQTKFHKQIEGIFSNLLKNNLLLPLNKLIPAKNNSSCHYNPKDISRDVIKDLLQTYTTIRINTKYPTKDANIKSLNTKIQRLEQEMLQRENLIRNQKDKEISDINNQLQQFKNAYNKQKTQSTTLQNQLQKTEQELKSYRLHGNINDLLRQIKEPVLALSEYFSPHEIIDKPEPKPEPPKTRISKKLVLLIVCIILLIFLLINTGNLKSNISELDTKISELQMKLPITDNEQSSTTDTVPNNTIPLKTETLTETNSTAEQGTINNPSNDGTQTDSENNVKEKSFLDNHPFLKILSCVFVGLVVIVLCIVGCIKLFGIIKRKKHK